MPDVVDFNYKNFPIPELLLFFFLISNGGLYRRSFLTLRKISILEMCTYNLDERSRGPQAMGIQSSNFALWSG